VTKRQKAARKLRPYTVLTRHEDLVLRLFLKWCVRRTGGHASPRGGTHADATAAVEWRRTADDLVHRGLVVLERKHGRPIAFLTDAGTEAMQGELL
jgi:hypothetical protein